MKYNILFLIFFTSLTLQRNVTAFPGAAGHCKTGDLSGKSSGHGENGGGPLSNGSLEVRFDGIPLTTFQTKSLNANQEYTVSLGFTTTDSNFFFRGLLFRLSGKNGEDVSDTFFVGTDGNVQLKGECDADVSAITHNSRDDKSSVSFNFEYTKSRSADLFLEVTVVRERAEDNWFYSSYNLQIGDSAPPEPVCQDSPFEYRMKLKGEIVWQQPCEWAAKKNTRKRCKNKIVKRACTVTCNRCNDTCQNSEGRFEFYQSPETMYQIRKNCNWVKKDLSGRCEIEGMPNACRKTCGSCT